MSPRFGAAWAPVPAAEGLFIIKNISFYIDNGPKTEMTAKADRDRRSFCAGPQVCFNLP